MNKHIYALSQCIFFFYLTLVRCIYSKDVSIHSPHAPNERDGVKLSKIVCLINNPHNL